MDSTEEAREIEALKRVEEETDIEAASIGTETGEMKEPSILYTFQTPYVFEGTTYNELDLSGITKLTTRDAEWLDSMMRKSGRVTTNKWHDTAYAKLIATRATGLPVEFFNNMKYKDFVEIHARIQAYFLFM